MERSLSRLGPPLLLAAGVMATAALQVAAPRTGWSALAVPVLLVLTLVAADLLQAHLGGRAARVSSSGLIMGATIFVASAAIASQDLTLLGGMVPILGGCAAVPLLLRGEKGRP